MAEETKDQRVNRELIELLNELRVALPGVQVLFAFLLTIPFSRGFPQISARGRDVYLAALLSTVVSTALLIAPSAYHRLNFRQAQKERLLLHANAMAIVGLLALAVAIACSVFFVTDYLFGDVATALATGLTAALLAWLWYALPLWRRLHD